MKVSTIALLVIRPGPLRNSLQTLLTTLPQIEIIAEARDLSILHRMREEWQPDLILIEAAPIEKMLPKSLHQIKQAWPNVWTIVLVDTMNQQQAAQVAGADAVLIKGFRAAQLVEIIEEVLPRPTSRDESIIIS